MSYFEEEITKMAREEALKDEQIRDGDTEPLSGHFLLATSLNFDSKKILERLGLTYERIREALHQDDPNAFTSIKKRKK